MTVTIQQIAEMAGVSRGTVDRALHHRGRVDPQIASEIERLAEELGYQTRAQIKKSTQKKKIGVITQLSASSFMIFVRQGLGDIRKKLARQGMEVDIRESEGVNEEEQLRLIDELEQEGMDALAIMAVDSERVRARLNQLQIPIITFNTDIKGVRRLAYVGLNNRLSGKAAAGLLAKLMRGKGKVLGIVGNFSNQAGMQRVDGFSEALRAWPDIELIGVQPSFDRSQEVGQIVTHAMTAYPDLGGILVISGGQAGIRKALEGRKDRPFVLLYDRTPRNAALLEDDLADFVIDQDGYTQGYRSVSLLADYLRWGKAPEQEYMYTEINIRTKETCGFNV